MKSLTTKLEEYRSDRVDRKISYKGLSYTYHVLGVRNVDSILFLTGGSGISEPFFELMQHFSKKLRCITLDVPAFETMADLAGLIAAIVKEESKGRIHLLGQSMGGMVAQVFLIEHYDLVDRIILCHTATSSAELKNSGDNTVKDKEKNIRLIERFPLWLLRAATRFMMRKTIKENILTDITFWSGLFKEGVSRRNKAELIAPLRLIVDFLKNYSFDDESFKHIAARILIIDSEGDKAFSTLEKEALCNVIPDATKIHFGDRPHMGLIEHRDEYIEVIEEFIFQR